MVDGQLREVLCVESTMYLTAKQRELRPFFKQLVPSQSVKAQVDNFMAATNWSDPNTVWVGLHVRRTDLRLRCSSLKCHEGVPVAEALPLSHYTGLMKDLHGLMQQHHTMRYYIATDDAEAEAEDEPQNHCEQQQQGSEPFPPRGLRGELDDLAELGVA